MKLIDDFRDTMNPPVFLGSAGLILAFVLYGTIMPEQAGETFGRVQGFLVHYFGWFYILAASVILVFVIWLSFSRYGGIRMGGDDARPEFHGVTWFTMLMAAGMGIGLVFFGVAEPVEHYLAPFAVEAKSEAAIRDAIFYSFFHWGLHPWAIYISFALPLAYFHFRHKLPLAPRSLPYPVIGERIHGWIGHGVDILATVGTLFGVGTSLGLGAMQINAGFNQIFNWPIELFIQLLIIAVITSIATVSVVTGLKVGIRRLSQFNIGLAGLILLFVLVTGPTLYILETFTSGLGYYVQNFPLTSFRVDQTAGGTWQANWTLFYWSWWIAWSPFVGVFAARISKGRTMREFIGAMLFVPTVVGFFWFSALGGTALFIEHLGPGGIENAMAVMEGEEGSALAFYGMLEHLPLTTVMSILGALLIVIFFVTSSDSGSLVDVMVTSGGKENPPRAYRIFWCVTEGVVAAALLVAGGLAALRTASLTPALPMVVFLLLASWGLVKALRTDMEAEGVPSHEQLRE